MRSPQTLSLGQAGRRFTRRLPRVPVYGLAELVLILLLAIQCARLVWTLVTPLGPVGDWRPVPTAPLFVPAPTLGGFDPFFRLSAPAGPVMVTPLDLSLHGVREDRATGRGSAIIGTPDGVQQSYGVGDEILPGVRLHAVAFDSVTIARDGRNEELFLDQSAPVPVSDPQTGAGE